MSSINEVEYFALNISNPDNSLRSHWDEFDLRNQRFRVVGFVGYLSNPDNSLRSYRDEFDLRNQRFRVSLTFRYKTCRKLLPRPRR
jgi:hypothetical protein